MSRQTPDPLLTVRAALVLLLSITGGLVASGLGYLAHHDIASAVLIGGGATGAAVVLFNSVLGQ